MFLVAFLIFWGFIFSFQFSSKKDYHNGRSMREYAFSSNWIVSYPKWLVILLFFNGKLLKFPITLVISQVVNYVALISFCLLPPTYYILLLKIWGGLLIGLFILMGIDHEIYCFRHPIL